MPLEFSIPPFEEIMKRLLKSGYDSYCFRTLAEQYYSPQEEKLVVANYEKSAKKEKEKELMKLSKKCSELPKFKGLEWQEVIFETICSIQMPRKWFKFIFGHVDDERELYSFIRKFLKREFPDYDVVDTYDRRSKAGIRWADFTLVKKRFIGYELVSLDAKVAASAFSYFLNQADDFLRFSDYTYLLCTPGLLVEEGRKWARASKVEEIFTDKLAKLGIGLYVVDVQTSDVKKLLEAEKKQAN
jgi:hypothetical protein